MNFSRAALIASLALTLCGCTSYLKRKQLEAVARDWCQVVRASQVLPVYPLTEDLQVGDIFLVTRPVGQEASLYSGKGFLPLDQQLGRLHDLDFQSFYEKSFGIGDHTNTPHHWQFPGGKPRSRDTAAAPADAPVRHRTATAWTNAPRAAFPSYSFKVKSGSGLKLALPVQGVPIGLNFLQAGSASGSITIADAYVYGVAHDQLAEKVRLWAGDPDRQEMFFAMRREAGRPLYVRVVNRVYLTGSVVVSLQSAQSRGGELSAGKSQEVRLLEEGDEDAAKSHAAILELLNKKVEESLPGGTVKFAQASSRAVTMNEIFDRPVAIGYLAFDFPILEDGTLGAPVSTLERLKSRSSPEVRLGELSPQQVDYNILVSAVASKKDDTEAKIYDDAALAAGDEFKKLYEQAKAGAAADRAFSNARREWLRVRADAADRLTRALRTAWEQNLGTP